MKKLIRRMTAFFCAALMSAASPVCALAADTGMEQFQEQTVYADQFQDVSRTQWFYSYVKEVYELGLVKGISESLFNPDGNVTIAESLALACRLNDIYNGGTGEFQQGENWYNVYIDYAIEHGIISSGLFTKFTKDATREEFASILAKALPEEALEEINDVEDNSIPDVSTDDSCADAVYQLYRAGILVGSNAKGLFRPDSTVTRAETAAMISRMADPSLRQHITLHDSKTQISESDQILVQGKSYSMDMSLDELIATAGSPDDRVPSEEGYTWYVYGTGNYSGFFMAGVEEEDVVALCASGSGFRCCGCQMGDKVTESGLEGTRSYLSLYTDKNADNTLYMVYLRSKDYHPEYSAASDVTEGASRIDYYLINAFREGHGCGILGWSNEAARAALLHSQDMAQNDYFSHINLEGLSPWSRMRNQGVSFTTAAENLATGYLTVLNAHDGLVNSASHRKNMLNASYQYVGIGTACKDPSQTDQMYITEDYF